MHQSALKTGIAPQFASLSRLGSTIWQRSIVGLNLDPSRAILQLYKLFAFGHVILYWDLDQVLFLFKLVLEHHVDDTNKGSPAIPFNVLIQSNNLQTDRYGKHKLGNMTNMHFKASFPVKGHNKWLLAISRRKEKYIKSL